MHDEAIEGATVTGREIVTVIRAAAHAALGQSADLPLAEQAEIARVAEAIARSAARVLVMRLADEEDTDLDVTAEFLAFHGLGDGSLR